ncbi:DUF2845 domain-containing protein [Pseudomonas sp. SH1-B]
MKSHHLLTLAALLAVTASPPLHAETMRCGSQLVSLGDRAFEVERKCGTPVYRDPIGYTLGGYDRREYRVEEWVYGPTNGMLSILRFEGNRLVEIERRREH